MNYTGRYGLEINPFIKYGKTNMIMIPDTETTLLRGGKMYEEGNEKSVGACPEV